MIPVSLSFTVISQTLYLIYGDGLFSLLMKKSNRELQLLSDSYVIPKIFIKETFYLSLMAQN